jgi:hypothetical protein
MGKEYGKEVLKIMFMLVIGNRIEQKDMELILGQTVDYFLMNLIKLIIGDRYDGEWV